eukprot:TRINITY_DN23658_c0_g1_i1.p2 TRINITY_DN23658_c0_g1~~TRINITY_DN23658_c0_g1_i1.p2  ORF type:complete len:104 (-),score=16.44 TRINITY_DN23658_c0_g1_i1:21-332(-)
MKWMPQRWQGGSHCPTADAGRPPAVPPRPCTEKTLRISFSISSSFSRVSDLMGMIFGFDRISLSVLFSEYTSPAFGSTSSIFSFPSFPPSSAPISTPCLPSLN